MVGWNKELGWLWDEGAVGWAGCGGVVFRGNVEGEGEERVQAAEGVGGEAIVSISEKKPNLLD